MRHDAVHPGGREPAAAAMTSTALVLSPPAAGSGSGDGAAEHRDVAATSIQRHFRGAYVRRPRVLQAQVLESGLGAAPPSQRCAAAAPLRCTTALCTRCTAPLLAAAAAAAHHLCHWHPWPPLNIPPRASLLTLAPDTPAGLADAEADARRLAGVVDEAVGRVDLAEVELAAARAVLTAASLECGAPRTVGETVILLTLSVHHY